MDAVITDLRRGLPAFRQSRYYGPIKILGGWIIGVLVFGWIFPPISEELLSQGTRDSVLVALRYNNQIPYRTYRPIELIIIAGIIVGVVCLFQPWRMVSYEYGFLLLLISTLAFILWSHVVPQNKSAGAKLPSFKPIHHAIGGVLAVIVLAIIAYNLAVDAKPEPPYGYTERQWNRGLREEQRQKIIDDEESTYNNFSIPFFVFLSVFPAGLVYFAAREVSASVINGDHRVEPEAPADEDDSLEAGPYAI
jgi:hypothetical protein